MEEPVYPFSLWRETASPAPPAASLAGRASADIAIVGGGYTALCAALRAIERGLNPVVLEAAAIGWGA
ncbi:FAD-dependent oxidoreductase, partial [Nitratireductor indicus]|nr:FAD-dependent oxidoreductase [Nitratireductor indicus]